MVTSTTTDFLLSAYNVKHKQQIYFPCESIILFSVNKYIWTPLQNVVAYKMYLYCTFIGIIYVCIVALLCYISSVSLLGFVVICNSTELCSDSTRGNFVCTFCLYCSHCLCCCNRDAQLNIVFFIHS